MRLKVHITLIFALGLATMASAQENNISFFEEQARKDAQKEQSSVFANIEDEKDFWNDQIRYETDLQNQNSTAYKVYINEKRMAYSKHAEACNNHCKHTDYYYQQASFYFTNKTNEQSSK